MNDKITHAVHATPYPNAPSIVIAYPMLADWAPLFDPNHSKGAQWRTDHFADLKFSHEHGVRKLLDKIFGKSTGRAVCAEFNARSAYSVMILPFVFGSDLTAAAITHPTERVAATPKGKPLLDSKGRLKCGKHECLFGTGTGSSVDIFFSPYSPGALESKWTADEILLHELVHASRNVRGANWRMPVSGVGGYPNQEEFIADLVQNIYISEKGKEQLFYYNGSSIKAAKFLDTNMTPTPRMLTGGLRFSQPILFAALAGVRAPFNPVRQVDGEYKALMSKIEHSG